MWRVRFNSIFKGANRGALRFAFLVSAFPFHAEDLKQYCQFDHPKVEARLLELSNTREWRYLIHFFDDAQSEIESESSFFLAPTGSKSAYDELKATVCESQTTDRKVEPLQQSVSCSFPARMGFLKKHGVPFTEQTHCESLEIFTKGLQPESLTYVYSSAYPNNPASMFGHTFIRINQKDQDPLLDYGVNYAALVPEDEPGYKYIPYGLLGLYDGIFQIAPYYRKVLEYNQAESRDLWEYDLNFSKEETVTWVQHIFELRFFAKFSYSFLKKNCTYQIAKSLQAIRPYSSFKIGNLFYVLPSYSVRDLLDFRQSRTDSIHYRPSLFKISESRFEQLSVKQQQIADRLFEDYDRISNTTDPEVLEAVLSKLEYERVQQQEKVLEKTDLTLRKLRIQRAKIGGISLFQPPKTPSDPTNQPDKGHGPWMISVFYRSTPDSYLSEKNLGFQFRFGLHDLVSSDDGYEPTFGVEILKTSLLWDLGRNQFHWDQIGIVRLDSWQTVSSTSTPWSWKVYIGVDRLPFRNQFQDLSVHLNAQPGFTYELKRNHIYLGTFLGPTWFGNTLWITPEITALFRISSRLKILVENPIRVATFQTGFEPESRISIGYQLKQDFGIKTEVQSLNRYQNLSNRLDFQWFF